MKKIIYIFFFLFCLQGTFIASDSCRANENDECSESSFCGMDCNKCNNCNSLSKIIDKLTPAYDLLCLTKTDFIENKHKKMTKVYLAPPVKPPSLA